MNPTDSIVAQLAPGHVIGGCRIIREINCGGMGCVHLAEDLTLKRRVALKTILPFQDDHLARQMFIQEARLCAQIDHPNVVVIHKAGEERGLPFIVMRYVEGKNLSEYLEVQVQEQHGPLPWPTVLRVMYRAVRGLAAVHRKGLVHRDIKPSNIMVSTEGEGRVLLMDFGLVREAAGSATTKVMGTPQFMSPEQCEGRRLDARSDIFSVGSTLYHLLTATLPFGKGRPEVIVARILSRRPPPPVHRVNPEVPPPVSDLVARAMAFDPRQRFQSAEELDRAMRAILKQLTPSESAPPASAVPGAEGSLSVGGLAPELAPLELVPEDLTEEPRRTDRAIWLTLGGAASIALLSLILVMVLSNRPPQTPEPPLPLPPPPLTNMVEIESGNARLGVSLGRVDALLKSLQDFPPIVVDGEFFEQRLLTVPVPKFWIDEYEVTNQEYLRFVNETGHPPPPDWPGGHPGSERLQHPVTGVTLDDAQAYARWANKQLPTVAQWMRAFRGDTDRLFPWGDDFHHDRANVFENNNLKLVEPVTATPGDVSPFRVFNLAGNVSELTRETTLVNGETHVIVKGGAGVYPGRVAAIAAFQDTLPLAERENFIGFRCVYEPPPESQATSPRTVD